MKILLDTRESSETKDILELFLNSEETMLKVGDIVVNDTLCIEHKTPQDFITSVFDGRLFNQISAMKDNYPHSYVFVSGTLAEILDAAEMMDRYNSIMAAVCSCYVRGCPIIFCGDLINLSEVVKVLGEKLSDGKARNRPVQKVKIEDLRLQFICGLPNINEKLGTALLDHFGSVNGVLNASSDELQAVFRIGETKATAIRKVLEG